MKQLELENELRQVVARVITQVEIATAQGRTDINLALEDALIPIIQLAYNLPHLTNLNRKQKNFPGIDLGDDYDRVAFQITSTTTLKKVKKTLNQFVEREYCNSFDELYVLMLVNKQSSYSQAAVDKVLNGKFDFRCCDHIIDLRDILGLVAALRTTQQERVLEEFKRILGEVDAYISYNSDTLVRPNEMIANLQPIDLPEAVYVADLDIDDKAIVKAAREHLNYRGKWPSPRSITKMALRLNDVRSDSWVRFDGRLFSFRDFRETELISIVDEGTLERLEMSDLTDSGVVDNLNLAKQLLHAEVCEQLKSVNVRMHSKDRFFFFGPDDEDNDLRKEAWVGKKKAIRTVYERKPQKKDPEKVAYHRHLSFDLSFAEIGGAWYAIILPSWYFSYNGFARSHWHHEHLARQKRLEHNASVRNLTRFTAYFLSNLTDSSAAGLRFNELVEFDLAGDEEDEADLDLVGIEATREEDAA